MAKRRSKTRTHVKATDEDLAKIPKSMVIHLGTALQNHSLTQLVKDTRNMMQPHTAISLRERKSNKLKDFVVMAGPLGVSQLMIFSQSEDTGSSQLRIARTPHGPTACFKIKSYSLCKDVARFLKHPKSISKQSPEFLAPPLLVMNGFSNPKDSPAHEKLLITMFQNLFPPISPQSTKVGSIKRVLLLNKDRETGIIEIRHYAIDTKLVDVSKGVKRLINLNKNSARRMPNLAKVGDMSDIILDPYANAVGYTSESEVEDDSVVDIKEDVTVIARNRSATPAAAEPADQDDKKNVRKRAVKLTELGPRMELDLVKIEEGICSGKVLHHAFIAKTDKEIKQLEQKHAVKRKLKEERKKAQQKNVDAKKAKKEEKKKRREDARKRGEKVESSDSEDESESEIDEDLSDFEEFST
ncbi:unnamed protein product [Kuraishia capsulata CBS 1993]|uniref:Brix domain-containing protein n=1 Tax=Kuraishia capsulata CBS 1993 TaxID=1382522 RepID=W6MRG2_9ASCO|nr:uncharacterized protein KUCA_T00005287001 [Kuraishia capsulata CBS 1993]CDK29299.1 unnamed protein product [Kuraishia capsulata CBS 1993]